MSAELIEKTREHVAALEAELEKWRAVLTLLGGTPAATKPKAGKPAKKSGPKPRKEGKAKAPDRPTSAGKTGQPSGKRAQHRAACLEKVRELLQRNPDMPVYEITKRLSIGWALASELRAQATA